MGRRLIDNSELNVIKYDGLPDFFSALKKNRVSGRDNSSDTGSYDFTGTHSFNEAYNLMVKGDRESYDMVVKLKKMTDALFRMDKSIKRKPVIAPEGYQPHVPNAIKGLPNSMMSQQRVKAEKKVIDVFYNSSIGWMEDPENLAYRGAILLSAIQTLETKGYSINLYLGKLSNKGYEDKLTGFVVNIKHSYQRLNVFKSSFYLVNPSFLRRIAFRVLEVEPDMVDLTNNGYGRVVSKSSYDTKLEEHILDNAVIFDSSVDIDINNDSSENLRAVKKLFGGRL
uniref:DUF7192 domain-containing protein n=1 Tax=Staphylococcus phage 184DA TaxID=3110532 RepID=A0AAU6MXI4_9CAUD